MFKLFRQVRVFHTTKCRNSARKFHLKSQKTANSIPLLLPARAGVCFRVVVVLLVACCCRHRCCSRRRLLLLNPGGLGHQLGYRGLPGGVHARHGARATLRRRGDPGQRCGGASALWLAERAGTGAPRRSSCRSSRTAPTPSRISKLSAAAAAVTQVRPSAAAGHQTAVTPRAGVYAV